ncbi:MAG: PAS domain S-box protein [Candidatus Cloacimonetes bacterium]|nr:PAS domain S-box protein [Candidatus Cloacimonadota bacterium]
MIIKDNLKRKLFYLVITFFITVIVILLTEMNNKKIEKSYSKRINNQDAHRLISKSIGDRFIYLEKELYRLQLIDDIEELEKTKEDISHFLNNLRINLQVLEKGGQLKYFKGSSDKVSEWDELPYYCPETKLKGKCQIIKEIPTMENIFKITAEILNVIDLSKNYTLEDIEEIKQLLNQAYKAIDECYERINLINRNANEMKNHLKILKVRTLYRLNLIRFIFILFIVVIGYINFKKTINKITEIIKERDLYTMNIKSMNKILIDKQHFIQAVFDSISVGIIVADLKTKKILNVNEAALHTLKKHYNDVIDTNFQQTFHFEQIFNDDNANSNNYFNLETELTNVKNEKISILLNSITTKLNERLCQVINFIDISSMKMAEQALRDSEEFNRAIVENSPVGISVRDKFGTLLVGNNSWRRIWNISDEKYKLDKKKRTALKFNVRDNYLGKNTEFVKDIYFNGGKYYIPELKLRKIPGRKTEWISHHFYAIKDTKGQVEKIVILTEDISIRKDAEAKLHEREIRYQTLIQQANDAIFLENEKGEIVDVNIQACKLTGKEKSELIGSFINELWFESDKSVEEKYKDLHNKENVHYESEIIHKNGNCIPIERTIAAFADRDGLVYLSIVRDMAERKKNDIIQSVLFNIANAVNTTYDLNDLFKIIHKRLAAILDVTNFFIALYEAETGLITVPYHIDKFKKETPTPQEMENGLTEYVIKNQKSLLLTKEKRNILIKEKHIPDFEWKSKLWLGVPLINQNGNVIGAMTVQSYESDSLYNENDLRILEFVSDQIAIAIERKKAENKLRESEEIIRAFMNSATDSMTIWNKKGTLLEMNKISLKMLNTKRTIKELMGKNILEILPAFKNHQILKRCYGVLLKNHPFYGDYNFLLKGIGMRYFALRAFKVTENLGVIVSDITARKESEERIKTSLKEKEVLLKEIHHRVKNNMQVISSLLNLQSGYLINDKDRELFKESQNRVKSMSLIHEKLYQSKDLANIEFYAYVRNLTRHLFVTFGINASKIKLRIEIEDIFININSAIPCGLIINELISNSLKYAFPDDKGGIIIINITKKESRIKMVISDDGVGIPGEINYQESETLGLQLVNTLSLQLDAKVLIDTKNGTEFSFEFTENV